jgi:protein-tyrosine phosphatase
MFCDIHNHVLPGVDDGAKNMDDTLAMIDQALHAGITSICATPHVRAYLTEKTKQEHHLSVAENLNNELAKRGITIDINAGCELYFTSEFVEVGSLPLFRYPKSSSFLLVELPPTEAPPWFADMCFSLVIQGVKILLAHPERNASLLRNPFTLSRYIKAGIHTQVTAGSIAGKYGKEIQEFALRIVNAGACTVVATDAHDTFRRPFSDISPAYDEIATSLGTVIADQLCRDNPRAILNGEFVRDLSLTDEQERVLLTPKKKKKFLFF